MSDPQAGGEGARPDPLALGQTDSWAGVRALVVGFDDAGFSAADNLLHLEAEVTVVADRDPERDEQAELLDVLGARMLRDASRPGPDELLADADLVVIAPEAVDRPEIVALAAAARESGLPVWGDVELARRLRPTDAAPWLAIAGPDPDAVARCAAMLAAVLEAAGLRGVAAGTGGRPPVEVMMDPAGCDVLVLGLAPDRLHHLASVDAVSAAVLAVEGAPASFAERAGLVYQGVHSACVYAVADRGTEDLVAEAEVVEGARAIGITLGTPAPSMLGVVEDLLVDRAFIAERATSAAELGTLADLGEGEADPGVVLTALAAAALARAHGVPQQAVRGGLQAWAASR